MSKQKKSREPGNKAGGTVYDDAFKTLLIDCPRLLIPVVNEVFGKSYTGEEQIILRSNEHFLPGTNSENKKRVTDSAFTILGEKPENYLFECQSTPDNSMIVRMFEYATQEAIDTRKLKGSTLYVTIPNAAVLFLRSTRTTPNALTVDLTTPGGSIAFDIRVMKMKDYSLQEIFDKGLYFLLPFYIFVHEKQLSVYNENDRERKALTDEYVRFMEALDQALVRGQISVFERGTILDMSRRVLQRIAAKYGKVQEGVGEIMGGRVLEYETKTAYYAGKAEGIAEGRAEGKAEGRAEGKAEGRAEGKAEGIIEGETEAKKRTARKMHAMGMDIKTIAEIIDVEENVVEEWLK